MWEMYPSEDYQSASAKMPSIEYKYTKDERWAAQEKLDELQAKQKDPKRGLTEGDVKMKLLLHEILTAEKE